MYAQTSTSTGERPVLGKGIRVRVAATAGMYVAAWLVGLMLPDSLLQVVLVHGLAGAAFVMFVFAATSAVPGSARLTVRARVAGIVVATLSLTQLIVRATVEIGPVDPSGATSRILFGIIDVLDVAKIFAIAVTVVALAQLVRRARRAPGIVGLTRALAIVLVIGSTSMLVPFGVTSLLLAAALLLLLTWCATVATLIAAGRETHAVVEAR